MPDHPPFSDSPPDREAMIRDLLDLARDMPDRFVRLELYCVVSALIEASGRQPADDVEARLATLTRRLAAAWADDPAFCDISALNNLANAGEVLK